MKDLYFRYNPEPSKVLLERGKVVDGSYFLADGLLHFGNEETIECEFEVAYMQSGICWTVVYFPCPEEKVSVERLSNSVRKASKLTGQDRLFRRHVEVSLSSCISSKEPWFLSESAGFRLVFTAHFYSVEQLDNEKPANSAIFSLANLPIDIRYSPEIHAEVERNKFMEEIDKESLEVALQNVIRAARETDGSVDELLKMGREQAQATKEEKLNNAPFLLRKDISFKLDDECIARLYWQHKVDDREYDSQPLAALRIYSRKLPAEWEITDAAEWICRLLSLSVGRMITWNHYYVPAASLSELQPKQYWRTQTMQLSGFMALTEERGYLHQYGLNEDANAIKLVEQIMVHVLSQPKETTSDYLFALSNYIYYASIAADDRHRSILLCALVESLYSVWEEKTSTGIGKEFPRNHSREIQRVVKDAVGNITNTVLPRKDSEGDEAYATRCKEFLDRIGNVVGNNLSESFAHKLKSLFAEQGWSISWIEDKIDAFVLSRNKLFHEHRFAYDDPVLDESVRQQKVYREIINIEVFVPLMIATLLQYRGPYWDRLHNMWGSMPARKSREQSE